MTPVIRIDDQVFEELKKRATALGLVFEPPNTTLRKVMGLDSLAAIRPQASTEMLSEGGRTSCNEYIVHGHVYCQNFKHGSSTWEIGHLKSPGRELLSMKEYPYVKEH